MERLLTGAWDIKGKKDKHDTEGEPMRTVLSSIYEAFKGRGFAAALAAAVLVLLLASAEGVIEAYRAPWLLQYGYHSELIEHALAGEIMTLALPIIAALPFTAAIVDDMKSGFIKFYLSRTSRSAYLAGRIIACGLSGALVLLLGTAFSLGILALLLLPKESLPVLFDAAGNSITYVSPIWGTLFRIFASGAFWAMLGMLIGTASMSRYMAYASPFVVYYVLIILCERYFDSLFVLYPKEWLAPSSRWIFGETGVLLIISELAVIAGILAAVVGRRRISDD